MPRSRWSTLVIAAVVLSLFPSIALAAPARVIIIRHGEKPADGNELNERGQQRAQALVGYFEHDPVAAKLGPPTAIFAMDPKGPDGSVRAIQTVTPLADSLGLTVDTDFKKKQVSDLVAAVMQEPAGSVVLICWEHSYIPAIVQALGWTTAPDTWAGSVFDRAWIVDFTDGKPVAFTDTPQHVLPGDSAQ